MWSVHGQTAECQLFACALCRFVQRSAACSLVKGGLLESKRWPIASLYAVFQRLESGFLMSFWRPVMLFLAVMLYPFGRILPSVLPPSGFLFSCFAGCGVHFRCDSLAVLSEAMVSFCHRRGIVFRGRAGCAVRLLFGSSGAFRRPCWGVVWHIFAVKRCYVLSLCIYWHLKKSSFFLLLLCKCAIFADCRRRRGQSFVWRMPRRRTLFKN